MACLTLYYHSRHLILMESDRTHPYRPLLYSPHPWRPLVSHSPLVPVRSSLYFLPIAFHQNLQSAPRWNSTAAQAGIFGRLFSCAFSPP